LHNLSIMSFTYSNGPSAPPKLNQALDFLLLQVSQGSGLPPNAIFPIKNFCTEYHPDDNPAVAPLLYHLLHHALLCSRTFLADECGVDAK
jgi:hypothetical protein